MLHSLLVAGNIIVKVLLCSSLNQALGHFDIVGLEERLIYYVSDTALEHGLELVFHVGAQSISEVLNLTALDIKSLDEISIDLRKDLGHYILDFDFIDSVLAYKILVGI